jgi:hypothetical protein
MLWHTLNRPQRPSPRGGAVRLAFGVWPSAIDEQLRHGRWH